MFNIKQINHATSNQRDRKIQEDLSAQIEHSRHRSVIGFRVNLMADPDMISYLKGEIPFLNLREHVKLEEQKWIRKAKRYSLYEDQPYRIK